MKMTKKEYLYKAVQTHKYKQVSWYYTVFTLYIEDNDHIKLDGNALSVKLDDEWITLTDATPTAPIFKATDPLTIDNTWFNGLKDKIETTVGTYLLNILLVQYSLENRVPYQNRQFSPGDIESEYIIPYLKPDDEETDKDIPLSMYKRFIKAVTLLRRLNYIFVVVRTEKSIVPPPDMAQFKKRVYKEFVQKYGEGFTSNQAHYLEFENVLMEHYKDYLKDDPTFGITVDRKVLNAKKKKSIAIGTGSKMTPDDTPTTIINSLSEGYPMDKRSIATIFNAIRYGSASRGIETQIGGVIAKMMIRALHAVKIIDTDCGSKEHATIHVTKHNKEGLYYILTKDGTILSKDNIDAYLGKSIEVRSPLYCKLKGNQICTHCASLRYKNDENALGLLAITLGGDAVSNSLSKFHAKELGLVKITLDEFVN